jgi:predicted acyltransferase
MALTQHVLKTSTTQRFITLDVFRGMTIFLMIIVNTQGSGAKPFSQLEHAEWNGCTLTDLVFPSFLFAVGNAMPFAFKKFEGASERIILYKIFKRSFLIFLVGYLLTWYATVHFVNSHIAFAPFNQTRIMAVLQRIGLCYLIAALIVHYFSVRWIIIISILMLLLYWALLYLIGDKGAELAITGNAIRKIDFAILGEAHMYREKGIVFDPEGLLSTIPATVNVLAGYVAGVFIIKKNKTYETISKLALMSLILIFVALCWNSFFPFNKKLWTSSYVVFTTGIDVAVISLLFYLIELKQMKFGVYFFSVFGKNPLFIYVLSNLFLLLFILPVSNNTIFFEQINNTIFQKIAPGALGCLLFAVTFTLLCWSVGWIMDKRKIYIRL